MICGVNCCKLFPILRRRFYSPQYR
jgi:hypothetical protein